MFFNKITQKYMFPTKALFLIYLIISSNYLGNLFSCDVREILNKNIYLKLFVAFITLYIFVISLELDLIREKPLWYELLVTLIIFVIFYISTRISGVFSIIFFIHIVALYIVENYKEKLKDNQEKQNTYNTLSYVQNGLLFSMVITLLIGLASYIGEKKIEYKENFSYTKFFTGIDCKFDDVREKTNIIKNLKSFIQN